jgi:LacI family transcriptional regulator
VTGKKNATIQDIAHRAGVGVGTVSRVLNNHPNVSLVTRQRVQEAIAELGYRRRAAAKALRTRKSMAIGFITDFIAVTPFAGNVICGAQDVAWQHDHILLLVNTNADSVLEESAIETMLEREVEGIIYATMWHREVSLPDSIREVPVALVNCFVEDKSLPSVVPDERRGGYEAIHRLLRAGHRRIGFVNHNREIPAQVLRREGYRNALSDAGIEYDVALEVQRRSEPSGGYEAMRQLLKLPNRPTAVFCFNDRMAMGAYDAIKQAGLKIPSEIAVIGYDNQELLASNLHPGLTSMELPHYEMGRWAAGFLLGEPSGEKSDSDCKMPCPLIERRSV